MKMRSYEFVYMKTNGIWRQTWDLILNILSSKRGTINSFSSLNETVHRMELMLFYVSDIDALYSIKLSFIKRLKSV